MDEKREIEILRERNEFLEREVYNRKAMHTERMVSFSDRIARLKFEIDAIVKDMEYERNRFS